MKERGTDMEAIGSFSYDVEIPEKNTKLNFYVEKDTLKKLQLGMSFASCLNIRSGEFGNAAVTRAIDANNITVYVKNEEHEVVSRVSLIDSDKGLLVISKFYVNPEGKTDVEDIGSNWEGALNNLAKKSGRDIIIPHKYGKTIYIPQITNKVDLRLDMAVCDFVYSDVEEIGGTDIDATGKEIEGVDAYIIRSRK
jgi:hypothetical protein